MAVIPLSCACKRTICQSSCSSNNILSWIVYSLQNCTWLLFRLIQTSVFIGNIKCIISPGNGLECMLCVYSSCKPAIDNTALHYDRRSKKTIFHMHTKIEELFLCWPDIKFSKRGWSLRFTALLGNNRELYQPHLAVNTDKLPWTETPFVQRQRKNDTTIISCKKSD